MAVKLKTKLTVGLIFLFLVILIFGILGIVNISQLSRDADLILKDNYESIIYGNNMLKALENIQYQKRCDKSIRRESEKTGGQYYRAGRKRTDRRNTKKL